jgi:hypothetical protein
MKSGVSFPEYLLLKCSKAGGEQLIVANRPVEAKIQIVARLHFEIRKISPFTASGQGANALMDIPR